MYMYYRSGLELCEREGCSRRTIFLIFLTTRLLDALEQIPDHLIILACPRTPIGVREEELTESRGRWRRGQWWRRWCRCC